MSQKDVVLLVEHELPKVSIIDVLKLILSDVFRINPETLTLSVEEKDLTMPLIKKAFEREVLYRAIQVFANC